MSKVHIQDLRLYNNAGMKFPVCKANAELLDLDASGWEIVNTDAYKKVNDKSLFCKHCIKAWNKRYEWARIPE